MPKRSFGTHHQMPLPKCASNIKKDTKYTKKARKEYINTAVNVYSSIAFGFFI